MCIHGTQTKTMTVIRNSYSEHIFAKFLHILSVHICSAGKVAAREHYNAALNLRTAAWCSRTSTRDSSNMVTAFWYRVLQPPTTSHHQVA